MSLASILPFLTSPAGDERPFVLADLEAALRAKGWTFEKREPRPETHIYLLKVLSLKFQLHGYDVENGRARSLQLRALFGDDGSRSEKINAANNWNYKHRYIKVYVDSDDDVVAEMDIPGAKAAITAEQVVSLIEDVWMRGALMFSMVGAKAD